MKTKITVLLLLLTIAIQAQTITSWAKMAPLGDDLPNRSRANMVTYNNEIYIFGGYDSGASQGGDFAKYNPATGKLTNLKTFRTSVNNYEDRGLFEVNGKFYFIYGGYSLNVYDSATGNWTSTAINNNSIMSGYLLSGGGFVIGNTVYFIGTGSAMIAYDTITKTFSKKANKPVSVRGFFSFSIGTKAYMGGGTLCGTNGSCSSSNFYEYDSETDVWTEKALLPVGMEFGTGTAVNGKGYAGFGNTYSNNITVGNNKWYEYNPATNLWTAKADGSNEGVYSSSTIALGTDIYRYGGAGYPATGNYANPFTGNLRKYNTITNQWTIVGKLGHNREQTAGVYNDGKIYVAGGMDGYGIIPNDLYEYDISANTWQKKSDFMPAQNHYNARNLSVLNNKLYLIGGYDPHKGSSNLYSNAVYEYDLATNIWAKKSNYPYTVGFVFTTTHNNELYAFGGWAGTTTGGQNINAVHKYNSTTNAWTSLKPAPVAGSLSLYNGAFCKAGSYVYYFDNKSNPLVYRYSLVNNTWEALATNSIGIGSYTSLNVFSYDNRIFLHYKTSYYQDSLPVIKEFNTVTNQFTDVDSFSNIPFASNEQLVVTANDGVYFGFGVRYEYPFAHVSNSWTKLRFGAGVSTDTGIYQTGYYDDELGDENYNPTCTSGVNFIGLNSNASLYDYKGNLYASVINIQPSSILGAICLKVESRPLTAVYYTQIENNKRKTYLNKSFIITNSGATPLKHRFYFTTAELHAFVDDYNTKYSTSKTINDIKIINASNNNLGTTDFNPLNNSASQSIKYPNYTLDAYGTDKYFEFTESLYTGELHLYLESDALAVDEAKNKSLNIYPNPVKDILHIQTSGEKVNNIVIYDISGRKMLTTKATNDINVSKLPKGNYVVQVETNKEVKSFKIIKE